MRLLLWEKGLSCKKTYTCINFPRWLNVMIYRHLCKFFVCVLATDKGFFTLIFNWSHPFAFCVFALDTVKSFWLLLKIQPPSTYHLQLKLSRDWVLPILFRETTEIPLLSLDTQELTNHNGSHKKEQIDTWDPVRYFRKYRCQLINRSELL